MPVEWPRACLIGQNYYERVFNTAVKPADWDVYTIGAPAGATNAWTGDGWEVDINANTMGGFGIRNNTYQMDCGADWLVQMDLYWLSWPGPPVARGPQSGLSLDTTYNLDTSIANPGRAKEWEVYPNGANHAFTPPAIFTLLIEKETLPAGRGNIKTTVDGALEIEQVNVSNALTNGTRNIELFIRCAPWWGQSCNWTAYVQNIYILNTNMPNTCLGNPYAEFTSTSEDGNGFVTVCFTEDAGGDNVRSYYWDFGDGTVSYEQNPCHVYYPGTYDVTLIVTNSEGVMGRTTKRAHVYLSGLTFIATPRVGQVPLSVSCRQVEV